MSYLCVTCRKHIDINVLHCEICTTRFLEEAQGMVRYYRNLLSVYPTKCTKCNIKNEIKRLDGNLQGLQRDEMIANGATPAPHGTAIGQACNRYGCLGVINERKDESGLKNLSYCQECGWETECLIQY